MFEQKQRLMSTKSKKYGVVGRGEAHEAWFKFSVMTDTDEINYQSRAVPRHLYNRPTILLTTPIYCPFAGSFITFLWKINFSSDSNRSFWIQTDSRPALGYELSLTSPVPIYFILNAAPTPRFLESQPSTNPAIRWNFFQTQPQTFFTHPDCL